jgi:hypothetical protein
MLSSDDTARQRTRPFQVLREVYVNQRIQLRCSHDNLALVTGSFEGVGLLLREDKFVALRVTPVETIPTSLQGFADLCSTGSWLCIQRSQPDCLFVVESAECVAVVPLVAVPESIADYARMCYIFSLQAFGAAVPVDYAYPTLISIRELIADTSAQDNLFN